ncbi:G-type lectin S-receptor-like serine/threonine-protein kinase At4g27290 [Apium graveolens]|uniref:G-type lectin S-receptor-like serine/threonine-protein kinase At4g27290 n=1 Tax=Apium graveolens TaxID=4045 RepID=UPI003D7B0CB0
MQGTNKFKEEEKRKERDLQRKRNQRAHRGFPGAAAAFVKKAGDEPESGPENFVWQSFDYPGDTMLPGMKFGKDLVTGRQWYYSSWKSVDDPSPGSHIHQMDTHGYPQMLVWKGSELQARTGPWEAADWTDGCVRINPLDCGHGDGFIKYMGVKLPDTRQSWYNLSMSLKECKSTCLKNCNCTAYSNINVENGGSGCVLWFAELMDIEGYTEDAQSIYVRMPASELGRLSTNEEEKLELPLFDFRKIANATTNFSQNNKIGEGGFGPVYKGMLEDGQLVAVKRLSDSSSQGIDEFKNEVSLIAKLQHRNLVSLLGYCIEEQERILIYEYLPNKSLDSFIFAISLFYMIFFFSTSNIF